MFLARLAIALTAFLIDSARALWRAALQPVWRSRHERELVRLGLATFYRGRLIPVMRGGDPRSDPLFPTLPTDLSDLEDDDLSAHRDSLLARIKEVAASRRDPDIVGDRTEQEVVDELEAAAAAVLTIKDELAARAADEAAYDKKVEELAAQAGVALSADTDDDGDTDGEPTAEAEADEPEEEPAAEAETKKPEPVAASAGRRSPLPAARRHRPKPAEFDQRGLRVTQFASAIGTPFEAGEQLDRRSVGEILTDIIQRGRVKHGQSAVIASATIEYPADRVLTGGPDSHLTNSEKVQRVIGGGALVASGALCAPLPGIYDLPGVESADRPVRDALPSFQATRGGVQVGATPTMGTFTGAVSAVTAADNALGGTFAVKNCHRIDCPSFTSVKVDSIYHCVEADNLAARAYPELMARIDELVRAEQARLGDSRLLTAIAAGSTAVTGGFATPGAVSAFLGDVHKAAAGMRSRHRIPGDRPLRALFPEWLIDLLALDIARAPYDRFATREMIINVLANAGVNATFHMDGSSTATVGQVFGAQSAGALLTFPTSVEWFLFPEGTWLHLDAGVLELGIVRDSTLNSTNDFQIFGETWENVAKVGVESLKVTTTVCANGQTSTPAAAPAC